LSHGIFRFSFYYYVVIYHNILTYYIIIKCVKCYQFAPRQLVDILQDSAVSIN